jgi:hypothetical protein
MITGKIWSAEDRLNGGSDIRLDRIRRGLPVMAPKYELQSRGINRAPVVFV